MQIQLPRLIFGATTLGNLFVARSDQEKHALVAQWFEQMPKPVVIDSAGKYGAGLSLEVIGRELNALGISPSDVIISNKLGWRRVPLRTPEPTFEPGAWVDIHHDAIQDISRQGILRCWNEGTALLGGYQAGLLSVHDPDEYLAAATDADDRKRRLDDIIAAYEALTELRDQGHATAIGVGAKDWRVIRELTQYCSFDWVMMANSFTIMNHPIELLNFIDSLSAAKVVIINSALMHGGFLIAGDHCDYRRLDPAIAADAARMQWRDQYHAACQSLNVDPFDVAVAFGLSHPAIQSVALSTSRPERVNSLVKSVHQEIEATVWNSLKSSGLISPHYRFVG